MTRKRSPHDWPFTVGILWSPVTQRTSNSEFDYFFSVSLNKQLSYRWSETQWRLCDCNRLQQNMWRHCKECSYPHLAASFHFPPEIPNVLPQLNPSHPHLKKIHIGINNWGQNKMATILQTTFSNAWSVNGVFFYFVGVQLAINQYIYVWYRYGYWLAANKQQATTCTNVDKDLWQHMAFNCD